MLCDYCKKIEDFSSEWKFAGGEAKWMCPACAKVKIQKVPTGEILGARATMIIIDDVVEEVK